MIETILLFSIGLASLILFYLILKRIILPRISTKRKEQVFRICKSMSRGDLFRQKITKIKEEVKRKESIDIVPVIHIAENSDIYLSPALLKSNSLDYSADKNYEKVCKTSKRISVHYPDGHNEEGYLCDTFSPANLQIRPSLVDSGNLNNSVKHIPEEYEEAFKDLENRFLSKSILAMSKDHMKIIILFFVAGMGIASVCWMGAVIIFTI